MTDPRLTHRHEPAVGEVGFATARLTPNLLDATNAQLHTLICVPGSREDATWSEGRRRADEERAIRFLDGMVGRGYEFGPVDFLAEVPS